jgi:hypothetical protein
MKKILHKSNFYWLLPVIMMFVIASCKKDNNAKGGTGVPTVEKVRLLSKSDTIPDVEHRYNLDSSNYYADIRTVPFDSTVAAGRLNNQYAIIGTNLASTTSVQFNGVTAYFNPALLTDKSIIVSIPNTVPFIGSNKLTVTTTHGTVDFNFPIVQPPPTITSFTPLAAGAGDIVTITGTVFDGLSAVKFDDVPAEIVGTPTKTEIKVKVPAGIVQAYIYVTTPGGTTKSPASFGFKYVIYDDALAFGWGGNGGGYDGYSSVRKYNSTEHPKRGANAIEVTVDNGYGALQLGYGGATLDAKKAGFAALKLSIYGGANFKAGDRVQVVVNNAYGHAFAIEVKPGVYTDYTIPLSALGDDIGPLSEITFQTLGVAAPATFYVDDLGFI